MLHGAKWVIGADIPVAAADDRGSGSVEAAGGIKIAVSIRPQIRLDRSFNRIILSAVMPRSFPRGRRGGQKELDTTIRAAFSNHFVLQVRWHC